MAKIKDKIVTALRGDTAAAEKAAEDKAAKAEKAKAAKAAKAEKAKAAKAAKAAAEKEKKRTKRVRILTPMAGALFSAVPGEVIPFPLDEADGLIASGAAEEVDTDEAKLRKMAKDAGFELVKAD